MGPPQYLPLKCLGNLSIELEIVNDATGWLCYWLWQSVIKATLDDIYDQDKSIIQNPCNSTAPPPDSKTDGNLVFIQPSAGKAKT